MIGIVIAAAILFAALVAISIEEVGFEEIMLPILSAAMVLLAVIDWLSYKKSKSGSMLFRALLMSVMSVILVSASVLVFVF